MAFFRRNRNQHPTLANGNVATVAPPATNGNGNGSHPAMTATPTTAFASTMMDDYPLTLQYVLDRAVKYFPKREIVTVMAEGTDRSNYGQMGARVKQLSAALAKLGVQKGDRVATLGWNTTRHFEAYFAIPCMGAVLHTLNLRLPADQLSYIIQDAADKVIIADADLVPLLANVKDALGGVQYLIVMNGPVPSDTTGLPTVLDYEALLAQTPAVFTWPTLDERDAAAMCYTSGTTGNPKGVVYSHRSSFLHAISVTQADTVALSGHDTAMPIVPMFHVNAWGFPHAAALVGAKVVFPGKFMDPARVAQVMVDEHVTMTGGVPTIWMGLLQVLAKNPSLDLSGVTRFVCGGSAAPPALIEGMAARGLNLLHAWGMTEMSPIGTVSNIKAGLEDLSEEAKMQLRIKQGYPVALVDLRIADINTNQELPWDGVQFGEIQVRGPWITRSYYHDGSPDAKFVDGWFRTGDVATIDPEGYVEIVDRTKDVIKSGGEWISSVQLENIIMGHPQVLEAAVIALPHPKWQERPVAAVVLKPEAIGSVKAADIPPETAAAMRASIMDYLQPLVAKWWLPDQIVFLDAVPKTSVGKFDKKVLRTQLAAQITLGE
jgi:fatty-acyl-CoA synthase